MTRINAETTDQFLCLQILVSSLNVQCITRVYDLFEKYNLLYQRQFGFRKKNSTNPAILNILEDIKNNLNIKNFVCGVFIDLEKAFDTVNHDILI